MTSNEMTKIEWCHFSFNAWWGCFKVSAGCANCYAKAWDKRVGGDHWGLNAPRRFLSDANWAKPLKWNRKAEREGVRYRVFCSSMADVFEIHPDPEINHRMIEARRRLCILIEQTPHLDWLLLTKRPENWGLAERWRTKESAPLNVWFGCTAENQEQADKRIPHLLSAPWPSVRFVSYEPALELVDFDPPTCPNGCDRHFGRSYGFSEGMAFCIQCDAEMSFGAWLDPLNGGIDWLICGAESGPRARPMDENWVRSVRDQCQQAGVPFFFKQKIDDGRKISLPKLDGVVHAEFPVKAFCLPGIAE